MALFKKNKKQEQKSLPKKDDGIVVSSLIKKVRELEIKSKKLTNHLFTGEYHSAFKGRGMAFKEVREYQPGDDIRFIEWNVSARMSHTYSKLFEEERELSVYLLVDMSASSLFGTFRQTKKELITEICAVLAFSAINNNDKVGVVFFSDKVEKYIPAKKGKEHALFIVRELVSFQPHSAQTDIVKALGFLNNVSKHKSIVFVLSDFADAGYKDVLRVAAKRHDVIGVQVYDKRDAQLPKAGLMQLRDAETGKMVLIDTNEPVSRFRYNQQFEKIMEDARQTFRDAGADLMQLATGEDYVKAMQQFFIRRA